MTYFFLLSLIWMIFKVVMSTDSPSCQPTQEMTIGIPPSHSTTDTTEYDKRDHDTIVGIAIIGSAIGLIIVLTMCIVSGLELWNINQSIDWKFSHLTLAQVEQHNLIIEIEAYSRLTQVGLFGGEIGGDYQPNEEENGESSENENEIMGGNETNQLNDRDPGVVVGIQLNSI